MQTTTPSNLRKKLKKYLDYVVESESIVVIPRAKDDDDDAIVMISLKEYNAMKETEHLLGTKANRDRLRESISQAEDKELIEYNLEG